MKTDEPTYIDFTHIELWRLGVKNSPRLDKVRFHHDHLEPELIFKLIPKTDKSWSKQGREVFHDLMERIQDLLEHIGSVSLLTVQSPMS